MVCTFFWHRDTPGCAEILLQEVLEELITSKKANVFYVGNEGQFDYMVLRCAY